MLFFSTDPTQHGIFRTFKLEELSSRTADLLFTDQDDKANVFGQQMMIGDFHAVGRIKKEDGWIGLDHGWATPTACALGVFEKGICRMAVVFSTEDGFAVYAHDVYAQHGNWTGRFKKALANSATHSRQLNGDMSELFSTIARLNPNKVAQANWAARTGMSLSAPAA